LLRGMVVMVRTATRVRFIQYVHIECVTIG
jgi:hypothetical protein